MTNFEKYKDKIKKLDCGFSFRVNKNSWEIEKCDPLDCKNCFFRSKQVICCNKLTFNWLCEEYKEHLTTDSINILKMFDSKFKYIVRNKTWLKFFAEKDGGYKLIDYSMFNEDIMNINFNILEENKRYSIEDLIEE